MKQTKNNNDFLYKLVYKVKTMDVGEEEEIYQLTDLLQNNEFIRRQMYVSYPIDTLLEIMKIDVGSTNDKEIKYGFVIAGGEQKDKSKSNQAISEDGQKDKPKSNQVIAIKPTLTYYKQREVKAYLLGLYLLDYAPNSNNYRKKKYCKKYDEEMSNAKAFAFATQLLMPIDNFKVAYQRAVKYGLKEQTKHRNVEINQDVYVKTFLGNYYRVSQEFIGKRIQMMNGELKVGLKNTTSKSGVGRVISRPSGSSTDSTTDKPRNLTRF